jgi:hypothetical protein
MPQGRVRNMDLDGIDVAVLSPNSPALDKEINPEIIVPEHCTGWRHPRDRQGISGGVYCQ